MEIIIFVGLCLIAISIVSLGSEVTKLTNKITEIYNHHQKNYLEDNNER